MAGQFGLGVRCTECASVRTYSKPLINSAICRMGLQWQKSSCATTLKKSTSILSIPATNPNTSMSIGNSSLSNSIFVILNDRLLKKKEFILTEDEYGPIINLY